MATRSAFITTSNHVTLINDACSRPLEPLVVEHESLDDVLLEPIGGPLPEADSGGATNAEPERDDHVEVVVGDLVDLAVGGSCLE